MLAAKGMTALDHFEIEDERIPTKEVRRLVGGVSEMTIHRWLHAPAMEFPKPRYLGRLRYWSKREIVEWIDSRPQEPKRGAM